MRVDVDHHEIRELLGAYSLHAVDATEAAIIERHIARCVECRAELEQHREVASLLSATERFAPAGLWESIVRQIPTDSTSNPPPPVKASPATVVPLRRQWLKPAAVAAALVLIGGTTVVQSVRLGSVSEQLSAERAKVTALNDAIERPPLETAVVQAMAGTDSQRLTLGSQVSGSNAIIVLMPDGTGYLAEHTLQPLPPDRTYQLWAIIDGKIISAGILGSDPGVVPFRIDPQGFAGFAITEETVGGVEASQNDPVIAWLEA